MYWREIILLCTLGTQRRPPKAIGDDKALLELQNMLIESAPDPEEALLRMASLILQYEQTSMLPPTLLLRSGADSSAPENRPLPPAHALALWDELDKQGLIYLQNYWLDLCKERQWILWPQQLSRLMALAQKDELYYEYLYHCGGQRWMWLMRQPGIEIEWPLALQIKLWLEDPAITSIPEKWMEIWETGTLPQRKLLLQGWRKKMPASAFLAVQKIWKEENANSRAEFLMGLGPINNQEEYLWTQHLLADKSQKVKDIAIEKIKIWPGSPIFQEILSAASDCIEISTNKYAMGLFKNNTLKFIPDKMVLNEEWKSWYFFLQSPDKNFKDKSYLLLQMFSIIPLSHWYNQSGWEAGMWLGAILAQKDTAIYLPAFIRSAITHRDCASARALLSEASLFNIELLRLLPEEEIIFWAEKKWDSHPEDILAFLEASSICWPRSLSLKIIDHLISTGYIGIERFLLQHLPKMKGIYPEELDEMTPVPGNNYAQNLLAATLSRIKKQMKLCREIDFVFAEAPSKNLS